MTEVEQIAAYREHYERQLEAMMDREIDTKNELKAALHRNELQANRIELLTRKLEETKTAAEQKDAAIEELRLQQQVLLEEVKEAARELRTSNIRLEDLRSKMGDKDKAGVQRLQKIDKLNVALEKADRKLSDLEKAKD